MEAHWAALSALDVALLPLRFATFKQIPARFGR